MASETEESVSTQGYGNVAHDLNGTDLYISSVKQLISALPDPSDKEVCMVWLVFIMENIKDLPVMSDYLILLLLSLHQRFRVAPFDKYPPPVSQIEEERIDVMAFGRRMIQQCTVKQKEEDRLNQCKIRKQKHKLCSSEAFPSMEFTSSEEGMEYFVSQKIPGFGRHCFFTTSNTKLPLWWPSSSSHEGKEDYLSKIAWKMYWEQATKVNELDDCMRHVIKVTTRGWWKKADKREKIDTNEPPLDFQWHKQSTLPDSTVKLNKNQIIEQCVKDIGDKDMDILSIDEAVEALHNKTLKDSDRISLSSDIINLFGEKRHGNPNTSTAINSLERLKKKGYAQNSAGGCSYNFKTSPHQKTASEEPKNGPISEKCSNQTKSSKFEEDKSTLFGLGLNTSFGTDKYKQDIDESIGQGFIPEIHSETFSRDLRLTDLLRSPAARLNISSASNQQHSRNKTKYSSIVKDHQSRTNYTDDSFELCQKLNETNPIRNEVTAYSSLQRSECPNQTTNSQSAVHNTVSTEKGRGSPEMRTMYAPLSNIQDSRVNANDTSYISYSLANGNTRRSNRSYNTSTVSQNARLSGSLENRNKPDSNYSGDTFEVKNAEQHNFLDQFIFPDTEIEFSEGLETHNPFAGDATADENWMAPPEIPNEHRFEVPVPPIRIEIGRRHDEDFSVESQEPPEELQFNEWLETNMFNYHPGIQEDCQLSDYLNENEISRNEFIDENNFDDTTSQWAELKDIADQLGFHNF